ncbi:acyl carrier protein [Streptomyces sp. NPDC001514]
MSRISPDALFEIMRACVGEDSATDFSQEGVLDKSFVELDFDSLALVELGARLEESFGINVPEEVLDRMETPRHALDYVNGLQATEQV